MVNCKVVGEVLTYESVVDHFLIGDKATEIMFLEM